VLFAFPVQLAQIATPTVDVPPVNVRLVVVPVAKFGMSEDVGVVVPKTPL